MRQHHKRGRDVRFLPATGMSEIGSALRAHAARHHLIGEEVR